MFVLLMVLKTLSVIPEDASDRYLDCLNLIETDIDTGRRAAQIWADEGGGATAQHCLAMADIAAGFSKLAAARLEEIAGRKDAGDDYIRARLLAQAADAWLTAEETDKAAIAIAAAFDHAPDAAELHLTAAKVHHAQGSVTAVIAAVDAAEQAGFQSADGYYLRGRAKLAIGAVEAAAQDVVNALSIDHRHLDALTLRGDVQRAGVMIDVDLRPAPKAAPQP